MSPTGVLAAEGPRWFTIPAHRPFLLDLARGLLDALPDEALAEATVLLPSRRGVRALAEAFVQAADGKALLLPQVRALGDLDEGEPPFEPGEVALDLPAAISPNRRRFELARLAADFAPLLKRTIDAAGALELADALAGFLDSAELEEVPPDGRMAAITGLVGPELAAHWQVSAEFLTVALKAWPERLAELGLIDLSARRVALLRTLHDRWEANPPSAPMIAAGSTGTAKANADLLRLIARLPQGAVVLPGLDLELADDAWAKVEEQHPQGAMKRLLDRVGVRRGDVRSWPASSETSRGRWRRRIVNEALRPAETTADWLQQIAKLQAEGAREGVDPMAEGLAGLSTLSARDEEEAAALAALVMRETLETPGKTCALITPDQALARRVSARLVRWGVAVDASAGSPLANAPVGVLMALLARAMVRPDEPVSLLAILKHPMVLLGLDYEALSRARTILERRGLRGARLQADGWIEGRLADAGLPRDGEPAPPERLAGLEAAADLLHRVREAIALAAAPFAEGPAGAPDAARSLAAGLESLARPAAGDTGELWAGPEGEKAAELVSALIGEGKGLPTSSAAGFAAFLERLLDSETVRIARAAHPRLQILGAIESRLVSADRLILAGLEEGVWPQAAPTDPFLSRPMREAFGLPPTERRIGLSAHDFAQAACAREVILLHCERREGAPAVESRWLWRLRTLARGAGVELQGRPELAHWAKALDHPDGYDPARPPSPAPPIGDRPRRLAVTRVEAWVRDPYAVYARHVLGLRRLDRPGEPVGAQARGTAIHEAFRRFSEAWPDAMPPDAGAVFERLFMEALIEAGAPETELARESALAAEAGRWMADWEAERRASGPRLVIETEGSTTFEASGGPFTVTARADRIEATRDGVAHVIDYKTGRIPSKKEVETGFSPQLTLTAAIIGRGGFEGAEGLAPGDLLYVRVTGRRPAGAVEARALAGPDSEDKAAQAFEGLRALVDRYDRPEQAYPSRIAPRFVKDYPGDYDHLARVREWSVLGDEAEGEGGGEP